MSDGFGAKIENNPSKKSTKKVHRELLILIGLVADPTNCFFYSQIQTIRDHYFEIPAGIVLNYFS